MLTMTLIKLFINIYNVNELQRISKENNEVNSLGETTGSYDLNNCYHI